MLFGRIWPGCQHPILVIRCETNEGSREPFQSAQSLFQECLAHGKELSSAKKMLVHDSKEEKKEDIPAAGAVTSNDETHI